jgi:glycosyltransferase involved in cell wall biosynthesis
VEWLRRSPQGRTVVSGGRRFVLTAFFDGRPEDGGAYVHKYNMLRVFQHLQNESLQVAVICSTEANARTAALLGLKTVVRPRTFLSRIWGRAVSFEAVKMLFGPRLAKSRFGLDEVLRQLGTDLVVFVGDDLRVLQTVAHNYVLQIWDFCHLENPEFPEVSHGGEFERREYLNRAAARKATAVVVDSEYGARLLQNAYGVDPARIHFAPFLLDDNYAGAAFNEQTADEVRARYGLKPPYIFYPAQFWPHKNHRYILRALRVVADRKQQVPQAVFCGSNKGVLQEVLQYAADLGVRDHVNYCGFVPQEHMQYLYKGSVALVMPTYFGPTNIPPMEAEALGVPVCYSDLPAFREQMGDRAHYMDLANPESLADLLERLVPMRTQAAAALVPRTTDSLQRHAAILRVVVRQYAAKIGPACEI